MIFTYTPEGAQPRTWEVKPGRLLSPEMEAVEKVTGVLYPQWHNALLEGSVSAIHALLWILLKRENPSLAYDEVRFTYDEFDLDYDLDEKAEIVENYDLAIAAGAPAPSPAFTALIEAYRSDLPAAEEAPEVDLDAVENPEAHKAEVPKDSSPESSFESGTSGTSPGTSGFHRLSSTG